MDTIYFITSAPIEYSFDDMTLYESFDAVSCGKKSAPLAAEAETFAKKHFFNFDPRKIKSIYSAPIGQTYATAKLLIQQKRIPNAKLKKTVLLNGIRFNMSQIINEKEFVDGSYGLTAKKMRASFIEKLCDGKLSDKMPMVQSRISRLLQVLAAEKGNTLCIGHSFFLKLTSIYLLCPKAFGNKTLLKKLFEPHHRPYGYLQGFSVSKSVIRRTL